MITHGTPLKIFQRNAVDHAVSVIDRCLSFIEQGSASVSSGNNRRTAISNYGHLLFEAPTGIGKTLMVGTTAELTSNQHKMLWIWFAPFSGIVEQTISSIRVEHTGLRPKSLDNERNPYDLQSGDVFVTTWSALAVSESVKRNARKNTESQVSIDQLISFAKEAGYYIGVVVDESHHGFHGETQAYKFYREVVDPDITLLATATPKDKDVELFSRKNNIEHFHRISVSRTQGVDAGLLKYGVRLGIFKPEAGFNEFIDLGFAALSYGVKTHKIIKDKLRDLGIDLIPLLLVQVESGEQGAKRAKEQLMQLGFSESKIETHLSDEPNPHLHAIASDERVEALIFKMSVGLGFNAPRASVLVSSRATVGTSWGIQVVGRIMRVPRVLQSKIKTLPPELQNGFVFIGSNSDQSGFINAADEINSIKDELEEVADNVVVVSIGAGEISVQETHHGQTTFLPNQEFNETTTELNDNKKTDEAPPTQHRQEEMFELQALGVLETMGVASDERSENRAKSTVQPEKMKWALRSDIEFPEAFSTCTVNPDNEDIIINGVISELQLEKEIATTLRRAANVSVEITDLFSHQKLSPDEIQVELVGGRLTKAAQQSLKFADRHGWFDQRSVKEAVKNELMRLFKQNGFPLEMSTPENIRMACDRYLALRPKQLKRAISVVFSKHIETVTASPIPKYIETDGVAEPSRLNIYGIFPPDLNTWERPFAELIDGDTSGTVKWWHRNPRSKPYSVSIPIPGHDNFYPDFLVGIDARKKCHGILLVETKERVFDDLAEEKVKAVHPLYCKPLMIYLQEEGRGKDKQKEWRVVEYSEEKGKNILDRLFEITRMTTY